jgi:hypothetical protein
MRLMNVSILFAVVTTLLMGAAFGADGLSGHADSLKDELQNLRGLFERRDASFKASTSAVFKMIDRARDAAEDVQKRAGKGGSRTEVGDAVNDLSDKMGKMRNFIGAIQFTKAERAVVRNVDVKFGQVLGAWNGYQAGGPVYLPPGRPGVAPLPPPPGSGLNGLDRRARGFAVRYLSRTYGVYDREVQVRQVVNLGDRHRVVARVYGRDRVVELDAKSGRIYVDRAVN